MPIKVTHQAGAAPGMVVIFAAANALAVPPPPLPVHLLLGLTAWGVSTWNDWDLDHYRRRMHFGGVVVRWSARIGYRFRTQHDKMARHKLEIDDLHRGPSHSIEWCVAVGIVFHTVAVFSVVLAPWALWFGVAAFAGTASHVVLDWMTPAGVPFSAVYNYLAWSTTPARRADRQVWRRHAAGWWIPLYEVSWWLRWIRIPWPMLADETRPGCEPGLFSTNRGAEHMIVVPILYGISGGVFLAEMGMLWPTMMFLMPWMAT